MLRIRSGRFGIEVGFFPTCGGWLPSTFSNRGPITYDLFSPGTHGLAAGRRRAPGEDDAFAGSTNRDCTTPVGGRGTKKRRPALFSPGCVFPSKGASACQQQEEGTRARRTPPVRRACVPSVAAAAAAAAWLLARRRRRPSPPPSSLPPSLPHRWRLRSLRCGSGTRRRAASRCSTPGGP